MLRKSHHGFWKGKLCFANLLEFFKSTYLLEKDISIVLGFQKCVLTVSLAKVCQRNGTVVMRREWFSYG